MWCEKPVHALGQSGVVQGVMLQPGVSGRASMAGEIHAGFWKMNRPLPLFRPLRGAGLSDLARRAHSSPELES